MADGVSGVGLGALLAGAIFTYAAVKGRSVSDTIRVLAGGGSPDSTQQTLPISFTSSDNRSDRNSATTGPIAQFTSSAGKLTDQEIAQLAASVGWNGLDRTISVAVALAESRGKVDAKNTNRNGTVDLGLWQVNSVHGYPAAQLVTASGNATAAHAVWVGSGWHAWFTYNSGAYLLFMPRAKAVT